MDAYLVRANNGKITGVISKTEFLMNLAVAEFGLAVTDVTEDEERSRTSPEKERFFDVWFRDEDGESSFMDFVLTPTYVYC